MEAGNEAIEGFARKADTDAVAAATVAAADAAADAAAVADTAATVADAIVAAADGADTGTGPGAPLEGPPSSFLMSSRGTMSICGVCNGGQIVCCQKRI